MSGGVIQYCKRETGFCLVFRGDGKRKRSVLELHVEIFN